MRNYYIAFDKEDMTIWGIGTTIHEFVYFDDFPASILSLKWDTKKRSWHEFFNEIENANET